MRTFTGTPHTGCNIKGLMNGLFSNLVPLHGSGMYIEGHAASTTTFALQLTQHAKLHAINFEDITPVVTKTKNTYPNSTSQVRVSTASFLSALKNTPTSSVDVIYADYCTSYVGKSDDIIEMKRVLHSVSGVAMFTLSKRIAGDGVGQGRALIAKHFRVLEQHEYNSMVIFICIQKKATDSLKRRVRDNYYRLFAVMVARERFLRDRAALASAPLEVVTGICSHPGCMGLLRDEHAVIYNGNIVCLICAGHGSLRQNEGTRPCTTSENKNTITSSPSPKGPSARRSSGRARKTLSPCCGEFGGHAPSCLQYFATQWSTPITTTKPSTDMPLANINVTGRKRQKRHNFVSVITKKRKLPTRDKPTKIYYDDEWVTIPPDVSSRYSASDDKWLMSRWKNSHGKEYKPFWVDAVATL